MMHCIKHIYYQRALKMSIPRQRNVLGGSLNLLIINTRTLTLSGIKW